MKQNHIPVARTLPNTDTATEYSHSYFLLETFGKEPQELVTDYGLGVFNELALSGVNGRSNCFNVEDTIFLDITRKVA